MDQPLQPIHLIVDKREYKLIETALQNMVSSYQKAWQDVSKNKEEFGQDYAYFLNFYKCQEQDYIRLISEIQLNDS